MTDIDHLSVPELLRLHSSVLEELKARTITSTRNNPTGDYAEWLFCSALGLNKQPNSSAGHDATDREGNRYQIKARRRGSDQTSFRPLSPIRNLDRGNPALDVLAVVVFDPDYEVEIAFLLPFAAVCDYARFTPHVNGWRIRVCEALLDDPRSKDVSELIVPSKKSRRGS